MLTAHPIRLSAPRIINWAYALLWWRSTHRPNYENSLLLEDPNAWIHARDVCSRFITNLSGVLGDTISEELNLHSYFEDAGANELEQINQLADYIRSSITMNVGSNESTDASSLITHLSYNTSSPFFHTPDSVRYLITSLVEYLYEIHSRECFSVHNKFDRSMIVYDPCAGYGELLWSHNKHLKKTIYYDLHPDAPGESSECLTGCILKRIHGSGVCERKSLSTDNGDQVDVIVSNPPHAWLPDVGELDWHYIGHHIDLLSPGGIYITTCSKKQFNATYDDDYIRSTILESRYLKYIIKLPNRLLRGALDAEPLILVFIKNHLSYGILYMDGTYVGFSHSASSKNDIIRNQDIQLLTRANGIISTFKKQPYVLKDRVGSWGVRILKELDEVYNLFS